MEKKWFLSHPACVASFLHQPRVWFWVLGNAFHPCSRAVTILWCADIHPRCSLPNPLEKSWPWVMKQASGTLFLDFSSGSEHGYFPFCKEIRKWWKYWSNRWRRWPQWSHWAAIKRGFFSNLDAAGWTQKNWLLGTGHPENSVEKANGITGQTDNLNAHFTAFYSNHVCYYKEEKEWEEKKGMWKWKWKVEFLPRIHLKWVGEIDRENCIWQHDRKYDFYHMGNFNMNF